MNGEEKPKYVLGYYYDSDDPYKILAADLAGSYLPEEVEVMISDMHALYEDARHHIAEEIDLDGNYGDWAMDLMNRHHKRKLKELSQAFAEGVLECMDLERLQAELSKIYYMEDV